MSETQQVLQRGNKVVKTHWDKIMHSHLDQSDCEAVEEGDEEEDQEDAGHVPVLLCSVRQNGIRPVLVKEDPLHFKELYSK
jgi:hypothetical protein